MKRLALISWILFFSLPLCAQDSSAAASTADYLQLRKFLDQAKSDALLSQGSYWNPATYQRQYLQLITISKKKQFYPPLLFDHRFVSHASPLPHSRQTYIWVDQSPQYKNFKEALVGEVTNSVVQSIFGSKRRANTGYYTPVGTRF
jgi:hypothetical protein